MIVAFSWGRHHPRGGGDVGEQRRQRGADDVADDEIREFVGLWGVGNHLVDRDRAHRQPERDAPPTTDLFLVGEILPGTATTERRRPRRKTCHPRRSTT